MDANALQKLLQKDIDAICTPLGVGWSIENYDANELDLKIDNPKNVPRPEIEQPIIAVLVKLPREQLPHNLHFHYA